MTVTIRLTNDFSNPFNENGFDVDFLTSQPTIAVPVDQAGPFVSFTIENGPLSQRITFDASLTRAQIDGKSFGSFITDESLIYGSDADDRLLMTDFAEAVYGGDGSDVVEGRGGNDILFGGGGIGGDSLYGGSGADIIEGARVFGGEGDDTLDGWIVATGDGGADTFLLGASVRIKDFSRKEGDRLGLGLDYFYDANLKPGPLKKAYFDVGNKSPEDHNDYFIYHRKSGKLYYDEDGDRGEWNIGLIGKFDAGFKLKASDFDVI